jgi:hypothetical protein
LLLVWAYASTDSTISNGPLKLICGEAKQKPTAFFVRRYQPFSAGHQRRIEEGLWCVGEVRIAVCKTNRLVEKNRSRSLR